MTSAIFFDNDGVLVDTEHLYLQATQEVLASIGIPFSERQYIELFLVQGRGCWHLAEARGCSPAEVRALRETRNARYGELLAGGVPAMDGIERVLESLHGRHVLGVVTTSRRDHFETIHASTGLLKYFDFVLAAGDYPRAKPRPDPYLAAIERSGVAPEACIAIEDSRRGLESATRAGIRCLVLPTGLTGGGSFDGAHRVLGSVAEIPDALREALAPSG